MRGLAAAVAALPIALGPACLPVAKAGTDDGSPDAFVSSCLHEAAGDAEAARGCIGIYADACMAAPGGGSTRGMSMCLAAELEAWEAIMADDWRRLRAAARRFDAAAGEEAEVWPTLRRSQRTWKAFREAECRAAAAPYAGGTIQGVVSAQCRLTLTAERAGSLRARADLEETR